MLRKLSKLKIKKKAKVVENTFIGDWYISLITLIAAHPVYHPTTSLSSTIARNIFA